MRGDVIETFKIINGFVNYGHNMFGTTTTYRTRNLNVTSHHPLRSAHDVLNNRVIKYWNQLPLRVRNSTSINAFKAGLDLFKLSNLIRLMDSGNYRKKSLIEYTSKR